MIMKTLTVRIPDDQADRIDDIAEEHDTSRAAVLRSAIDDGLRAHKYYPDEFGINPERYERRSAPELAEDGDLRQ
jgi:hypothetical protein